MRFVAEGRTAEVFAWGEGRVVKLDRPDWTGLSHYEAGVLVRLGAAGVPAPQVYETVTVEGRTGVVLEYLAGPSVASLVRGGDGGRGDVEEHAVAFARLHQSIHRPVDGLPDMVDLVWANIERADLDEGLKAELLALLADLDTGERLLCHGDLNGDNVILTGRGPVPIDWLTAATGPPAADLARTLVLLETAGPADGRARTFIDRVRTEGAASRGLEDEDLDGWVRVMAAARLDEGFTGAEADRLRVLATGRRWEYERVTASVVAWARRRPDIAGVAVVGSWARDAARMDSDLDLVILTTDVAAYVEDGGWIAPALGETGTVVRTQAWGPLTERRVRLASGFEVEFGFTAPAWASTTPVDPGTAAVVRNGCRPLHDPDALVAHLLAALSPPTGSGPLQTPR